MINCSINTLKISINLKKLNVLLFSRMLLYAFLFLSGLNSQTSGVLYPYSTQATNRPNRHELIFLFGGRGGGGIREVSLKNSPIVIFYESVPIQIRCRYEFSGESAQFGWYRAIIHYD